MLKEKEGIIINLVKRERACFIEINDVKKEN